MSDRLAAAQALVRAGNFEAADRIIKTLLSEEPDNVQVWIAKARLHIKQGYPERALQLCRDHLTIHPDNRDLLVLELACLYRLGKKRELRKALDRFEQQFPPWVDTLVIRGTFEARYGSLPRARQSLEQLETIAPDDSAVDQLKLHIFARRDDWLGMRRTVRQQIGKSPDNADSFVNLAHANLNLFNPLGARRAAIQARRLDPCDPRAKLLAYVSLIVLFPPFFMALSYWSMMGLINRQFKNGGGEFIVCYFGMKLFTLPGAFYLFIVQSLNIPHGFTVSFAGFFLWLFIHPFLLRFARLFGPPRPVSLIPNY